MEPARIPERCSSEDVCLLLVLRTNEAANVSPHPLQDDQEGQEVDEQSDSLQKDGGMDEKTWWMTEMENKQTD